MLLQVWDQRLNELSSIDIGTVSARILSLSVEPLASTTSKSILNSSASMVIHICCCDCVYVIKPLSTSARAGAAAQQKPTMGFKSEKMSISSQKPVSPAPSWDDSFSSSSLSPYSGKDSSLLLIPKLSNFCVSHPVIGSTDIPLATCFCVCDVTLVVGKSDGGFILMSTLITNSRDAKVVHEHAIVQLEACSSKFVVSADATGRVIVWNPISSYIW